MILSSLALPNPSPVPAVFLISLYLPRSPLCHLSRCLLHPLLWLVVVCWANGVGHPGRRHRLLDHHRRHLCLPNLPSRGAYDGDVRGRKRAWWQLPWRRHSAIAVLWKGMQSEQEDIFMVLSSTTSLKTVFFCNDKPRGASPLEQFLLVGPLFLCVEKVRGRK